jgi:hypothetical protein
MNLSKLREVAALKKKSWPWPTLFYYFFATSVFLPNKLKATLNLFLLSSVSNLFFKAYLHAQKRKSLFIIGKTNRNY